MANPDQMSVQVRPRADERAGAAHERAGAAHERAGAADVRAGAADERTGEGPVSAQVRIR